MKNYLKGISTAVLMILAGAYFGIIQINPTVKKDHAFNNQNSINANYAGVFSFTKTLPGGFSELNTRKITVSPVAPLTDQEACTRVAAYQSSAGGKYGAFLTKTLIDNMFNGNTNNGIWIFLGKSTTADGSQETNFIVKSSTEDYTTEPTEGVGYFRIDAVCPNYCDGMDVSKCK